MIALTVEPQPPQIEPVLDPPPSPRREPDLSVLEDRAPNWAKLSRNTAILTFCCAALFAILSLTPLWHTDVWGHISYGRWIVQNHALPKTEPLLPLCEGVPFIDTAWLSQVIGFLALRSFGPTALQFLYAASITFCCALLGGLILKRTGSIAWAVTSIAALCAIDYQQLIVARPQLAGLACFVITLAALTSLQWRRSYWFALPAVFALWANLHGSFLIGLALIGCFAAGRAVDLYRRTGQARLIWRDATFRRRVLLLQLCAAAVLLNPNGLLVYIESFKVAGNANLQDLIEWEALTLRMMQGRTAAAALVALFIVYRLSPRRVCAAELLSLLLFGLGACWASRILVWWGPLAAYFVALHGSAITRRRAGATAAPAPRNGLWTVATIGFVWIAFAYTPFGMRVIHGAPKTEADAARRWQRALSVQTPVDAVAHLRQHPPKGLVFNTYEWGDYLLFAGPPGIQCFVASHAHLIPREVWEAYMRISGAASDTIRQLDRYGVNTVITDKQSRADLIRLLREAPDVWQLDYEDPLAAIFTRKKSL
jgi:hypothetical protein